MASIFDGYTGKERIDQRFEFLLTKQERMALGALAKKRGVSRAHILRQYIRRAAVGAGL